MVGWTDLPHTGDELHHFGWNACSSALCPTAPHPHVERRSLIVPGLRSSRIYVIDTKDDPRAPRIVKEISPDEFRGLRVHQTRLQGGDASSDSYCFPSAGPGDNWPPWPGWAPSTASTRPWAGCSPWPGACRNGPVPCC